MRRLLVATSLLAGTTLTLTGLLAADNQLEQIKPGFARINTINDPKDPKHTPKIECPDKVKAGEWFDVTVTIGHEATHPSLVEHHVRWIAIFKGDVELARAYLHPVHTLPKVTFTIALERTSTLRALEEPTHSAPWEAARKIEVEPAPAASAAPASPEHPAGSGSSQ